MLLAWEGLGGDRRPLVEILALEAKSLDLANLFGSEPSAVPDVNTGDDGMSLTGTKLIAASVAFFQVVWQRADSAAEMRSSVDDEEKLHRTLLKRKPTAGDETGVGWVYRYSAAVKSR